MGGVWRGGGGRSKQHGERTGRSGGAGSSEGERGRGGAGRGGRIGCTGRGLSAPTVTWTHLEVACCSWLCAMPVQTTKETAVSEDRAHDLRIMGPTRCQLRYSRYVLLAPQIPQNIATFISSHSHH